MEAWMSDTKQSREVICHMLSELANPSKELTKWEQSFYESIIDQFDRSGSLSEKQFDILERIYSEKTD